ncbi:MAG TPA: hypothetical protein VF411_00090 [Bacteroidia bacterium]
MKINYSKTILIIVMLLGFTSLALAQTRKQNNKKTHFLATGEVFKCNIDAKVENGISNSIKVTADKSCDVAIRVVDKETDVCIRYAFINAGESYTIDDIPVGKYYAKVGLGKGWFWEDTTSHCAGGFKENAIYKKFNDTYKFKKGQVGSYTLELRIVSGTKKPTNESALTLKEFQK